MPPKSKKTKPKKSGNNSQAKLKYINSCVKTMVDEMPRQTFSHMIPMFFHTRDSYSGLETIDTENENILGDRNKTHAQPPKSSRSKKRKANTQEVPTLNNNVPLQQLSTHPISVLSSTHPVILKSCLWNDIPHHPNVFIICAFCHKEVPSQQMNQCMEQPHSRRRFTPMCDQCQRMS